MTDPTLRQRAGEAACAAWGHDPSDVSGPGKDVLAAAYEAADAVLAITEADKRRAVAAERRRVVAEARRVLVSPWGGGPGAGPGYVLSSRLRDFERLLEMLPLAAEVDPEAANAISGGRCGDCGHPWEEHLRDLGIEGYVPQGCTWPSCQCTELRTAGR